MLQQLKKENKDDWKIRGQLKFQSKLYFDIVKFVWSAPNVNNYSNQRLLFVFLKYFLSKFCNIFH